MAPGRSLELLFGADSKAAAILSAATTSRKKSLERIKQRVKTAPSETAWVSQCVGLYQSEELGLARISTHEGRYGIEFESWSSDLCVEEQTRASRQLVLISPPWQGGLRLQVSDGSSDLILDGGQAKYVFTRIPEDRT